jgi:prophage regulatory protein
MTVPQILRRAQLEARLGLARSSIYKMMDEGTFPRPVKLGRRAVGWRSEDIETWLEDLQEQSND